MIIELESLGRFDQLKTGILGGSFDPPHIGHLKIAELLLSEYQLDAFIFIPAAQNPLKANSPEANNQQRLRMLQILLATSRYKDKLYILDYELTSDHQSYSVNTLKQIREYTNAELYFVMGTDQLDPSSAAYLPKWHKYSQLFKLANLVFMQRNDFQLEFNKLSNFSEDQINQIKSNLISFDYSASSTELRKNLKAGEKISADNMPSELVSYIMENNLYAP